MIRARVARLIAQRVFDTLSVTSENGRVSRRTRKVMEGLRRFLVRRGDPPVRFLLAGHEILIPISHELPFYLARHREYARAVGRIAGLVARHSPDMTFIDIGANVGDTVLMVREAAQFPILCVEGDPLFARYLRANLRACGDVTIAEALLDGRSGAADGELARSAGSARLHPGVSQLSVMSLDELLQSHPAFRGAGMVKVDTDGMDARILQGALQWIEAFKPVLFFEYDPDLADWVGSDLKRLMVDLAEVGYETALIFENTGEYSATIRISDAQQREDLHARYIGLRGTSYADVCVFPADRARLAATARDQEVHHAMRARSIDGR